MKQRLGREVMAMRIAQELEDGAVVNLGIGLPTLVANYLPADKLILIHSENGILGVGPAPEPGREDPDLCNAGGQAVTLLPGGSLFSHMESFAMVRGRHVDVAILGGLQVSERGDLANWMLPQRGVGSIGGGADIARGAKRVYVAMEHTTREGEPKVLRECSYPLTGRGVVHSIFTDLAVIRVTDSGLVLEEVAPGWSAEEVQAVTDARLAVSQSLREIHL